MGRLESSALAWRRSSRCDSTNCVEVIRLARGVRVRNNTRPEIQLAVDGASWHSLLHDLRDGRFDR